MQTVRRRLSCQASPKASSRVSRRAIRRFAWIVAFCLCAEIAALAQTQYFGGGLDNAFARIDFAEMYLDQNNGNMKEKQERRVKQQALIDAGVVSALDLDAPNKDIEQFNRATTLLKAQKSKDAIQCLQKAVADYPKFVSAHIGLGLAYLDQDDAKGAKSEFETAAKLDDKYPASFLNLGRLALSQKDFPAAQLQLEKAASLLPKDTNILSSLAYAQNGNHQYQAALETAHRVHALDHKGMANVHYVAAAAALALNDFDGMEREFNFFLSEDPTNAFAPAARKHLAVLAHNREVRLQAANLGSGGPQPSAVVSDSPVLQTFPNTERLKAQLSALGSESENGTCDDCGTIADAETSAERVGGAAADVLTGVPRYSGGAFTIRKNVDQVALFFAVSSHGHMVNGLEASDIQVLDDNKAPEKIVQFAPQSKLPLRLALIVDTSGSVHERFSFEKHAAAKFVQKMLSGASDLAFVAGFSTETNVTQDFTADQTALGNGIEKLTNGGGTSLFDAVSFACWKLAAYPDDDRVARVLVILSDGEDNSSHSTLKQAIQAAEQTGVTIYTVSTREDVGDKTDADRILEVLAERSGGEAMFPRDVLTLGSSFDKLHDLIRSRYFIAYKPAGFEPNGSYRTIRVIAQKNGQRLQVRTRKGYHARLEANHN